jgi:hypothetical protein
MRTSKQTCNAKPSTSIDMSVRVHKPCPYWLARLEQHGALWHATEKMDTGQHVIRIYKLNQPVAQ